MMNPAKLIKRLLQTYGTSDPFALCAALGIDIYRVRLVEVRGYHTVIMGKHIIVIADKLTPTVATYVCAHELGHFFMHRENNRVFMDSNTYMVAHRFENEADRFACNLLFGEPPLYTDYTLTEAQLAECLNVAENNVTNRLIELGVYI